VNGYYNTHVYKPEEIEEMEAAILAVAETWKAQQEAPATLTHPTATTSQKNTWLPMTRTWQPTTDCKT
jgi:hypothetical protein